jgi:hypothetical protein
MVMAVRRQQDLYMATPRKDFRLLQLSKVKLVAEDF